MASFTIPDILEATGGSILWESAKFRDITVEGISTDTRSLEGGSLFIPLVGENFDGHDFLGKAIDKGAGAILTQRADIPIPKEIPTILVLDTLRALQDLAAYHRQRFQIPLIAITGSNGKTTTKDMIALVLSRKYRVLKTEGNLNNEIGLPLTLLELNERHEVAVVEMGMSDLGEIHRLAEIARPTMAAITNIGVSHLESLGTKENILKAKLEIFDFFTSDNGAVLNGDDEYLKELKGEFPFPVEYFGLSEDLDIRAENLRTLGEEGIAYDLNGTYPITVPLPGKHNAYNSLVAIAMGGLLGVGVEDMAEALKTFRPGEMRLNIINTDGGIRIIDDVYNASPDSTKASIEILRVLKGGRKIAILGDMLELGNYSEKGHIEVGKALAQSRIDILITLGKESRNTAIGAEDGGMEKSNIYCLDFNKDVMVLLDTILKEGDTILVKGSRGMKMEEIVGYLRTWGQKKEGGR